MELRLLSDREEVIIFSRPPVSATLLTLPGSDLTAATGDFGSILVQDIKTGHFTIYYNQYNIEKDCKFYFANDEPSLELHFMSLSQMEYNLSELGSVHTAEKQFNMTYLPYIENVTSFKGPNKYATFDIHFPVQFLETLTSIHPLIDIFLKQVLNNKGVQYSSGKQHANSEMIDIINHILFTDFAAPVVFLYLESKAIDLLLLSLKMLSIQSNDFVKPRATDIERIHEVERIIMANLENPLSLIELAHRAGINDYKLKKLFKHVYGMTVFEYIMMKKLENARYLVLETELPFTDIAFQAGFKNVSNFNEAFKRKFVVTPGYMRKHK